MQHQSEEKQLVAERLHAVSHLLVAERLLVAVSHLLADAELHAAELLVAALLAAEPHAAELLSAEELLVAVPVQDSSV